LFIANDYGVSELYFNDGKQFHDVSKQTGVGFAPKSGMTAAFGDVLNQGKYAIYVSNISEDGVLIQGITSGCPRKVHPAMACDTRIWREPWASKWAAGAGECSSAISTMTVRWMSI